MKLKEIDSLLYIDSGASAPMIVCSEYKLHLLYYYHKSISDKEYIETPKERNIKEDKGIAILTFSSVYIHKFGYPNDEVLMSHPYYKLGLESYGMFEVEKSDWIDAIEKMNRVHPFHKSDRYKTLKHYIITFKDATFECITEKVELSFTRMTLNEAMLVVCSSWSNDL